MTSRAGNTRRPASRTRTNDENALPTQAMRTKTSMSHLGPAQKVVGPAKKIVAVKAGAKRTALGGVVGNSQKEDMEDTRKSLKTNSKPVEARQPLASRTNNVQARPIAPVPHRVRSASFQPSIDSSAPMGSEDDIISEMDVDSRRMDLNSLGMNGKIDEEGSTGEVTEEEEEEEEDEDDWLRMSEEEMLQAAEQLDTIRAHFRDDVDMFDTTMVAEYAEDIFKHMEELEMSVMPNARYMDFQTEIEWTMRTTLIDWLLQVHLRYHMLPETLWIAVNLVDRFLSVRVVSLVKLQLVGVTAMFIAAKYEEILAPSVEEFVYMTENGYTKDEILKGERIILQTLDFTVSSYCSPYSWVRRISKADDYDIQTRTLSKFLMEVTLLDHRFIRCKPSMIAAVGMYLARKMLGGDWNESFIFHSNFTEAQLVPGATLLCERLVEPDFTSVFVYQKYSSKKFLRASTFAKDWAQTNAATAW